MSFKQDLTNGVAYTAIAKYLGIVVSIVVTAILARLLTPEDFAIAAIATIAINFITLLTGTGLSPAIIQEKSLSNSDIEHIFSFTIYLAIGASILFAACTPIIANFYNSPLLKNMCYWLVANVFFSILNIVPNALLFKEKRFRFIAIRTIIIQVILGVLSILGALNGLGVYSLLINPIGSSFLLFIISYRIYRIKLLLKFDFGKIMRILPYSLWQISFNILNYSYRNIDKILIGRYIGMNALGYYEKSYRLMMMPLDNFSNVINPVLHPLLSEYQTDKSFIFNKYKKLIQYFGYIGFIITTFCFFNSKDIILILFGEQWIPSILIFKILSLSIGIQIIQSAVGAVFQATGRVKLLFYAGLSSFVITVSSIIIGIILKNLPILAILLVIAFFLSFFIYHYALINRVMHEKLLSFLCTLIRPIASSIIIGIILFIFQKMDLSSNIYINLISNIILTIITIILLQQCKLILGLPNLYLSFIKFVSHAKIR